MGIFRRKSKWAGVDVLDLIPLRIVENDRLEESGQVVLLVPRFREPFVGRFLQRLMPPPRQFFKVPLEERGSMLWLGIDGLRTVRQLVDDFARRFPDDTENMHERVSMFLINLYQNNFIQFKNLGQK